MSNRSDSPTPWTLWLALIIHTALVVIVAPPIYWALVCLQYPPFHFGMLIAAAVGIPASYLVFGLPLLGVAAASAAYARWLSKAARFGHRLGLGAAGGCLLGLALGTYMLSGLRGSDAFGTYWFPCPITGALLGACFTGLWRLSYKAAAAVVVGINEPSTTTDPGPAAPSATSKHSAH
jgi:hypothetical protein